MNNQKLSHFFIPFMLLLMLAVFQACTEGTKEANQSAPYSGELEAEESNILRAAINQLVDYLKAIPEDKADEFGFDSTDDFSKATLGSPYKMYALEESGQVSPLGYWRIPVIVDGKFCTLVSVKKTNGGYRIFGVGGAKLATELQRVESESAASKSISPEKLSSRSFIRSYTKVADFVAFNADIENKGPSGMRLIALESARMAMASSQKTVPTKLKGVNPVVAEYTFDDIVSFVKQ